MLPDLNPVTLNDLVISFISVFGLLNLTNISTSPFELARFLSLFSNLIFDNCAFIFEAYSELTLTSQFALSSTTSEGNVSDFGLEKPNPICTKSNSTDSFALLTMFWNSWLLTSASSPVNFCWLFKSFFINSINWDNFSLSTSLSILAK
ncbi:hypothetical protein NW733_03900 [Mycoplasmopsis felis]|uniref:hypothetical protein n=1 Tax=Mycoplasmopsis felis TaxID=33923 RepID=UPI0021DFF988|nr:hypothetical protein [Mycoplasmopsis felis]MCU9931805.1 hypothetical protein [Mycoplasmopsis felis]